MVVAYSVPEQQARSSSPREQSTQLPIQYTRQEVLQTASTYFGGDTLATDAFVEKYPVRLPQGIFLENSPSQLHWRLAREFARIEARYPNPLSLFDIFDLFDRFRYVIPQGSPMAAVGNDHWLQSASNCFVIASPHDSYGGILLTDQEQAQIMKRRGGVGFDISPIRPRGQFTTNAARTTDGIGVFMERYSRTCREVAQEGRRGALLMSIDVRHPEIETFIHIKRDRKKVNGANISIRFTDAFMKAVQANDMFQLQWPVDVPDPQITRMVKARDIWSQFVDAAWDSAEPGALFWDTVKRDTVADCYSDLGFGSISTNPCGEIVLSAYDSCRLMVLNVLSYVRKPFTDEATFDFPLFADHTAKAQRLMDDLVDLEVELVDKIIAKVDRDPEPHAIKAVEMELWQKIRSAAVTGRRTGLGVTALGDALAALNLRYGSKPSVEMTEQIYRSFACAVEKSNCRLAAERGTFPIFAHERERDNPYMNRVWEADSEAHHLWEKHGRRNICTTTTAPGGSISMLALSASHNEPGRFTHGTTSGIEPVYLLKQIRRRKINSTDADVRVDFVDDSGDKWQEYEVFHPGFKRWMEITGKTDPEQSPYWGATARDVDWLATVDLQSAAQRWISHSISKTCNLPESATRDLVDQVYMRAWEAGCKGFTIYREGSRSGVILDGDKTVRPAKFTTHHAPKRPQELPCRIHRTKTHENGRPQNWVILIGLMDGLPYEIFGGIAEDLGPVNGCETGILRKIQAGQLATYDLITAGGHEVHDIVATWDNPTYGAFTRTLSLALRHGAPIQYVVEQLQKDKHSGFHSFSMATARVLKSYIPDGTKSSSEKNCPRCAGTKLIYQEGCVRCASCSWSKC